MITLTVIIAILFVLSCIDIHCKSRDRHVDFNPYNSNFIVYMMFMFGFSYLLLTIIYLITHYLP